MKARQATPPLCTRGLAHIGAPFTAHQVCRPPLASPDSTNAPPPAMAMHAMSPGHTATHGIYRQSHHAQCLVHAHDWNDSCIRQLTQQRRALSGDECALESIAKTWTLLVRHPLSGSSAVRMSFECARLKKMQVGLPVREITANYSLENMITCLPLKHLVHCAAG